MPTQVSVLPPKTKQSNNGHLPRSGKKAGNPDLGNDNEVRLPPLLKWAGGKRWLVPHIKPYWEENKERRLVEPFCGGLAVTLGLMPKKAILNDINGPLINLYRWVKKGLTVKIKTENDSEVFYANREKFNLLLSQKNGRTEEAGELFYYLNRTGYNGLCRFNSKGKFNVPFGRHKTINYAKDFFAHKKLFKSWRFTNKDFEKIDIKPDDFIYADPPYDVEFTKYSKEDFSWEDQTRLAEFLTKHKGPVILSNQATERIVSLYEKMGFSLRFIKGPRRISCNGDRTPMLEVMALKGL